MIDRIPFPLRLALRSLRRRPGFSILAVTILALGIGANGAVFSILDATLLRALPFAEPDALVDLTLTVPASQEEPARDDMVWSYPKYQTFVEAQHSFSATATYRSGSATLLSDGAALRLATEQVGAAYFRTLGVRPSLGRDFGPEDDAGPDAPAVVILSDMLWRSQFGADPVVVGRTMRLGGVPATVIGVGPRGFRGLTGQAELWINIGSFNADELTQRWSHSHSVVARLAPGTSFARARAEVDRLGAVIDAAHPARRAGAEPMGATARPLNAIRTDPALARTVVVLGVAVGLVLLIACVNLANLLLARALGRRRELAVCLAIGARRSHIVTTLLVESAVLGLAGGVLGLALTWLGVQGLASLWTGMAGAVANRFDGLTVMGLGGIGLSSTVVLFLVGISLLTALLVGLLPALRASRPDLAGALHGSTGAASLGRARLTLRDGLVAAQLALAVTLLVGAGLLIRSMGNLLATDAGVEQEGIASARIAMSAESYQPDSAVGFYAHLLDRVRGLPGVTSAAIGNCPPLNGGCNATLIWFRDRPEVAEGQEPLVGVHTVSPGWFETLGVRLLRGRDFTEADRRGGPKVVLINESAARAFYPDEDPIGRPIAVGQGGFHVGSAEIIGVVSDVRFGTLQQAPMRDVFLPYLQAPRSSAMLFLRTGGDPERLLAPLRALLRELDPDLPVYDIRTIRDRMALATVQPRFTTWVLGAFAAAALALAAVGIYALLAFEVAQRRREIGIRMALGSGAGRVVGGVMRRGLTLAAVGILIGIPLALVLSRFLASLLFGVTPGDPLTYAGISVLLGLVAAAATLLPARAATRVNPMEAIRTE